MPNFLRFLLIKWLTKLLAPYGTLSVIATVTLYYDGLNKKWVFDDDSRQIKAEGFHPGIGEMINEIAYDADFFAEDGCQLSFSSVPFPGYQAHLVWQKNEDFGNWYIWKSRLQLHRGWLCPVLNQYFQVIPQDIYVKIEAQP